ncbi:MAG: Ig-like domain-containing protein [Lautropia sp.]
MSLTLEIKPADGPELRTRLTPGRNRLSVRVGDTFRIYDDQTGLAPKGISVRRVDNSLIVDGLGTADGTNAPVIVEFAEFYTLCSAGSPCQLVIDPGAGGTPVATITPGTPPIGALADGGFVLYDPQFTAPEVAPVASSSIDTRTVLYGTGGLLIAGAAAAGGGGGGDGGGGGGPVAGGGGADPTLKLSSSTTFSDRTPVIHGEGEPGTRILVRIDTNGDGSADVTYATTVGADNRWAIDLATATPESGALPSTGLPDHATVGITQSGGAGGNVNLPPITLSFDGVPPAAPTIHIVAGDDIVNTAEKTGGIIVTGTAEAGATVLLDWGGHAATAAVDAEGQWQTVFAATEVPNDGPQTLSVLVRDPAGNLGPAATRTVLVDTGSARLVLGVIAGGDGRVTVADGNSVGFSGSADPDAAVTVGWNGLSHVTTAAADGTWATTFTGAEVPQANGTDFGYTITAVNARGNLASANGSLLVDRQPPAAPTFAPITGDNRVSVAERADGVAVSGQSEAGATLVISWAGVSRSATAGADGRWSVRYGAGELPVVASPGQNTTVTAVATDTAGNQGATASQTVFIEQPFAPPTIGLVAGDDVVSAAERAANIVISGTVQAGAPGVTVTWGSFSGAAAITGTTWRITVPAARVPGDGDVAVNAAITGSPGQATSRPVHIDVTAPTAPVIGVVESDDRVTLAERADGVVISGTAQANARSAVSLGGHAASTDANASGAWSVSYAAGDVPT